MNAISILIPRVGWCCLDNNHHIFRWNWKQRAKFGTRRKGCAFVQLGKGYKVRNLYGWRFWCYRKDGSCWSIDLYFWNRKQNP